MVFSSLIFLYAFLPASLIAYRLCRGMQAQNICLLVFSLIFYAWGEPIYVLLLAAMALLDWYLALRISRERKAGRTGKPWLLLACIGDLGLIGFFKYSGMVASLFGPLPPFIENLALPIGISFYTFQLLTYVVDVYRGQAEAREKYWHVLLYAALFHQCIAGPIVRYGSIERELFVRREAGADMASGVRRFAVGLAKKTLLANPCGAMADSMLLTEAAISGNLAGSLEMLRGASALQLWVGVIAYFFQIYFDFSAYSDMAIGMGRMLGLHYPENFDYPYISKSVTEFWRRWHISLGTFFRDYVYIPLGGSRRGRLRTVVNLFVVWALTGLWHGADWNFVLWGLYYFVILMVEKLVLRRWLEHRHGILGEAAAHLYVLIAVLLGWILFRFSDLRAVWMVVCGLFGANGNPGTDFLTAVELRSDLFLLLFSVIAATPLFKKLGQRWEKCGKGSALARTTYGVFADWLLPVALLLASTACLVGNSYNPFLYFKF